MGRKHNTEGKREAVRVGRVTTPGEWGDTMGSARPPEWAPIPTEWSGRRWAARALEWRKNPGRSAMEWKGGGRVVPGRLDSPRRGRGVESSRDNSTPTGGEGGVKSWQDDSTHQKGGGVESSRDDSTPRGGRDPEGDETPGTPPATQSRGGEDGQGRGEGNKTQPPTRQT